MNRKGLKCLMIVSCFVMLAPPILTSPSMAQDLQGGKTQIKAASGNSNSQPNVSIQPLLTFSDHAVIAGGGSTLIRTDEGVYMSLHAFGLTPDTVATVWWAFFNKPKKCATSPCSVADLSNADAQPSLVPATGRIVGADGTADFGAFKAVGDATDAVFGPGLLNSQKAEIHLAVRTHGRALLENAELLRHQLTQFNGGCPPNTCSNLQGSIHQP